MRGGGVELCGGQVLQVHGAAPVHGAPEQLGCALRPVRGRARQPGRRSAGGGGPLVGAHRGLPQFAARLVLPEECPDHGVAARPFTVRGEQVVARHRPAAEGVHHVVRGAGQQGLPARGERPRGVRDWGGGHHGDGRAVAGGGVVEGVLLRPGAGEHEARGAAPHGARALHAVPRPQHRAVPFEGLVRARHAPRAVPVLQGHVRDRLGDGHGGGDGPRRGLGAPEVRHPRQADEREPPHPQARGGEADRLVRSGLLHDPVRVRREQGCAAGGEVTGHEPRVGPGGRRGLGVQHGNPRLAQGGAHAASPQLLGKAAREQVGVQVHGDRGPRVPGPDGGVRHPGCSGLGRCGPHLGERLAHPAGVRGEERAVLGRRRLPPAPRGAHHVRRETQLIGVEGVRAHELRGARLGPAAQDLRVPGAVHPGDVPVAVGECGEILGLHVGHPVGVAEQPPAGSRAHRAPSRNVASGFSSRPA